MSSLTAPAASQVRMMSLEGWTGEVAGSSGEEFGKCHRKSSIFLGILTISSAGSFSMPLTEAEKHCGKLDTVSHHFAVKLVLIW